MILLCIIYLILILLQNLLKNVLHLFILYMFFDLIFLSDRLNLGFFFFLLIFCFCSNSKNIYVYVEVYLLFNVYCCWLNIYFLFIVQIIWYLCIVGITLFYLLTDLVIFALLKLLKQTLEFFVPLKSLQKPLILINLLVLCSHFVVVIILFC